MLTNSMAKILRISFGLSAVTAIALIQGCASIVSGQDQIVSVDAPLCPASKCKLQNEEGVYWIPSTPGTVAVDREYGDLVVTCSKPGYQDFTMKVSSSTKGMAFGNILLGGFIGAGVDMGTGAAYDYPTEIIVPLDCRSEAEIAEAPTTGKYTDAAAKLVDVDKCEKPQFVFMDGTDEIYKARCEDGRTGVLKCGPSNCIPLNVSSPADSSASSNVSIANSGPADTAKSTNPPKHEFSAIQSAKLDGCEGTVTLVEKNVTKETYFAKCSDGSSRAVECEFNTCESKR